MQSIACCPCTWFKYPGMCTHAFKFQIKINVCMVKFAAKAQFPAPNRNQISIRGNRIGRNVLN